MTQCPCCSEKLLRHLRRGQVEWFCIHCWQIMPDLKALHQLSILPNASLSASLSTIAAPETDDQPALLRAPGIEADLLRDYLTTS